MAARKFLLAVLTTTLCAGGMAAPNVVDDNAFANWINTDVASYVSYWNENQIGNVPPEWRSCLNDWYNWRTSGLTWYGKTNWGTMDRIARWMESGNWNPQEFCAWVKQDITDKRFGGCNAKFGNCGEKSAMIYCQAIDLGYSPKICSTTEGENHSFVVAYKPDGTACIIDAWVDPAKGRPGNLTCGVQIESDGKNITSITDSTTGNSHYRNLVCSPLSSTPSPSPTASVSPSPTVTVSPSPTTAVSPSPTVTVSPSPTTAVSPSPTVTVSPRPTTAVSPSPTVTVSPSPTTAVSPSPTVTVSPSPTTTVSPSPTVTVSPRPTTAVSPSPTVTISPSPSNAPALPR